MERLLLLTSLFFTGQVLYGQHLPPQIHSVMIQDAVIEKYDKFEVVLDLSANYDNPYDYDDIAVSARFTAPDGRQRVIDGFYMHDFDLDTSDGTLSPVSDKGRFKVRFSPDQTGSWTVRLSVSDRHGRAEFDAQSFRCIPTSDSKNKGFIRNSSSNYLHFDSGEQYIPVGENIAWQNHNAFLDYRSWLTRLRDNGGNYFRLWHAHWGLGIEWKDGWNNFEGLRHYHEINSRYQDWLFDFCAENGIYVMLCLQHHGQVSTQVNPNWSDNPYNAVNGGPCQNTWDFFLHEEAKDHTMNRLRYVIARWGYARSILAWELFNEVDWTDNFDTYQVEIADWHAEMAGFLKAHDPYDHLITTSYAHERYDSMVWINPDIDITQTHFYLNTPHLERALAQGVTEYLADFDKPTLTGEFGLGIYSELSNEDPDGIHFHNAMWAALFAGGMGSAMSWWWDSYVHPRDLYYHFAPLSAVAAEIPFLNEALEPVKFSVSGAPGDLMLIPTLGWGAEGDTDISFDENGDPIPPMPDLSIYLYGSQWNTQYRQPPTFTAFFSQESRFVVTTASTTGTNPRIAIFLDGEPVLEQAGKVNETYTITVPAGEHSIRVDNTGTDWITIASYTFGNLGSQVDAYVVGSPEQNTAAGWVLNNLYNHQFVLTEGEPPPAVDAELSVDGFPDGGYAVQWYDCLTGDRLDDGVAFAENGQLRIPIPELYWDRAFLVSGELTGLELADRELDIDLYPNPAAPGATITVSTDLERPHDAVVSLLDMEGRTLRRVKLDKHSLGRQGVNFSLPTSLPSGMYWVRLESEGRSGSRPVVIKN